MDPSVVTNKPSKPLEPNSREQEISPNSSDSADNPSELLLDAQKDQSDLTLRDPKQTDYEYHKESKTLTFLNIAPPHVTDDNKRRQFRNPIGQFCKIVEPVLYELYPACYQLSALRDEEHPENPGYYFAMLTSDKIEVPTSINGIPVFQMSPDTCILDSAKVAVSRNSSHLSSTDPSIVAYKPSKTLESKSKSVSPAVTKLPKTLPNLSKPQSSAADLYDDVRGQELSQKDQSDLTLRDPKDTDYEYNEESKALNFLNIAPPHVRDDNTTFEFREAITQFCEIIEPVLHELYPACFQLSALRITENPEISRYYFAMVTSDDIEVPVSINGIPVFQLPPDTRTACSAKIERTSPSTRVQDRSDLFTCLFKTCAIS